MSHAVEFGSKADADAAREEYSEHVCPVDDDRRLKTVHFVSDIPDAVLDSIRAEADEGRSAAEQGTQMAPPLSEGLREKISDLGGFDKSTQTTFNWRKAKAIYAREGFPSKFGDDIGALADYDDPAEGAVETIERRKRGAEGIAGGRTGDSGGARHHGDEEERARQKEEQAAKRQQAEECDHAHDHCRHGDPEACEFLAEVCGFEEDEIERIIGDEAGGDGAEADDLVTVGEGEDAMEVTPEVAGALKRSWGGYQGALADVRDALDSFQEAWNNAQAAGRAVNEIRAEHGQDPLHFEELEEVQADLAAFVRQMARDCEECHLGEPRQATLGDIDADEPDGTDVDRLAGIREGPLPAGAERIERAGDGSVNLDRTAGMTERPPDPKDRRLAAEARARRRERRRIESSELYPEERADLRNRPLEGTPLAPADMGERHPEDFRRRRDRPDRRDEEAEMIRQLERTDPDLARRLDLYLSDPRGRRETARERSRERREMRDPWAVAVETIRDNYGDGYQDRVEFAADVRRAVDMDLPQSLADEGVTQPILRYQEVPPADAFEQIVRRAGESDAERIREALIEFAGTLGTADQTDVIEADDQRTLGGDRADDQTRFAGGERGESETQIEGVGAERNPGGLAADEREGTTATDDLETATVDAFQVAEGGQGTLGDHGGDE